MQTKKFQGVQTFVSFSPDGKEGDIMGFYRNTCVAYKHRDGSVTLNSGGWLTYTTKARINQFAAEFCGERFRVYQRNKKWFVSVIFGGQDLPYVDGMTIPNFGTVEDGKK